MYPIFVATLNNYIFLKFSNINAFRLQNKHFAVKSIKYIS
jgi:hypothetical protein